eukprot:GHUV01008200.1.p1 GENE.GHUV01008200.1~~GHUV01008200.1.p1  ORF type:complete len:443 (+),score=115.21 GHUV01008200.1:311-1639(+)
MNLTLKQTGQPLAQPGQCFSARRSIVVTKHVQIPAPVTQLRQVPLQPLQQRATPRSVTVRAAPAATDAELLKRLEQLQEENKRLKQELAKFAAAATVKAAGGAAAAVAAPGAVAAATEVPEAPITAPPAGGTGTDAFLRQLELGVSWPTPGTKFWEQPARVTPMPVDVGAGSSSVEPRDSRILDVVHFTAELAPIAKVGGLGDVVHGLARTCLARGHNVTVIMPFYECLPQDQIEGLGFDMDIDVPKGYTWDGLFQIGALKTAVFRGVIGGVPVILIRPSDWNSCNLFRGGRIYGGSYNEMESYLYFCRAALEYLRASGQQPHVMHLHEWQTAAAAMLYWEVYSQLGLYRPRVVLTVHNLDNTGECRQDEFAFTGVDGEVFATIDRALDERTIGHNPERLNLMKVHITGPYVMSRIESSIFDFAGPLRQLPLLCELLIMHKL